MKEEKDILELLTKAKESLKAAEMLINSDIHKKLNPEYVKKLDKIEKENKRIHFRNIEEFDEHFGL